MTSPYRDDKLATVFGGSGFIGRAIVGVLAKRGWRVRAACRRPDLAGYLQPMGVVGQIHGVQANLRYPDSIRAAVEGAQVVINAVGILAPAGKQTFDAVHARGAGDLAQIAHELGVRKLAHISAIGADAKSSSRYARSKAEGEAAVGAAFPEAIILRPSIVFGPNDSFFNRFAAMARISPVLPLIGGGTTKFQPVYVGDLALAAVSVCDGAGKSGETYEIGGPAVYSFRELMELTQRFTGRDRYLLNLPFWLARLQALLTWPLPNALRPITLDQIRLLECDHVVNAKAIREGRTIDALGVSGLHAVEVIVPGYLERFKPKGQYAGYRG